MSDDDVPIIEVVAALTVALLHATRALKHLASGDGNGVIGSVGVARMALSHVREALGEEAYLSAIDTIKGPADG